MNVLCIDADGSGLDFCLRAQAAGHKIRLFVGAMKGGERRKTGDGMVPRVDNWRASMRWADLVFLTGNDKYMAELEPLKQKGFPIFSSGVQGTKLEVDRGFGQQVIGMFNIPVIPYEEFTDFDSAIEHVAATGERYVSKPMGDEEDKALTHVAKSPEDLVYMLSKWKKAGKKPHLMLQEFTPGVEFGVTAIVGPHGFNKWKFENFEHKKLMTGEKGPNTGEMGTLLKPVKESKLFDITLAPLEDYLVSIGYIGPVDMNCIVAKDTPYPLEFTSRPGWPIWRIMQAAIKGDPVQWMLDAHNGVDSMDVDARVHVGVVLAQPGFPYGACGSKDVTGVPLFGIEALAANDVSLGDVMLGEVDTLVDGDLKTVQMPVTCGDYIAIINGRGKTVRAAQKQVYNSIDKINIPNSALYRVDIGDRAEKDLPLLQKHGFATEWEF